MSGLTVRDLIEAAIEVGCPFCGASAGHPCSDIDGEHQRFLDTEQLLPDSVEWVHGPRIGVAMQEVSVK